MCEQIGEIRRIASDLVIIGRTEGLISGLPLEETLIRAEKMVSAGADAVLVHSKDRSGGEPARIAASWRSTAPLVVVPTAFPQLNWQDLGRLGFQLCIYANQLSRAAASAMQRTAADLMTTGSVSGSAELMTVHDLIRLSDPENGASI